LIQGYIGEKNTALKLKELGSEYRVMNNRNVSSRAAAVDIDHLIVGPNGIFHIETKNWHGSIRLTEQGIERSQREHHEDPSDRLTRQAFILKELLRSNKMEANVTGIINFADPHCELEGSSPLFITVRLDKLISAITKHSAEKPLNADEVYAIVKLLEAHSKPSSR
jgi:hypothetical protein